MKYNTKTNTITIYAANIATPFLYSFLLWKGWTALAPHLNCPLLDIGKCSALQPVSVGCSLVGASNAPISF